jgi:tRNA threonylcarbamoyl adenosine modification protein (Sua5/YciO/YrdC/YwlC family)
VLGIEQPGAIEAAVAALRRGELIAYPTDTLYGVGGNALDATAARRTYDAKGRPEGKGFPVLLADAAEADRLAAEWPTLAQRLAARYWPGALTLVVRSRREVPEETRTGETIALRVPGYVPLRHIIRAAGCPLIGTSANRSGEPAALTATEAAAAVGNYVALVLDGGRTGGAPSTVVVVEGDTLRVVREGAIPAAEIEAAAAARE